MGIVVPKCSDGNYFSIAVDAIKLDDTAFSDLLIACNTLKGDRMVQIDQILKILFIWCGSCGASCVNNELKGTLDNITNRVCCLM